MEDKPVTDILPPVTVSPTAPTSDAADSAGFAADVDLDRVPAGAIFRATWTFRNSGPTTWDRRYRLVYATEGHPQTAGFPLSAMGAASATIDELGAPEFVRPGESVSLTLTFTAPESAGTQATSWQLAAPDGSRFGPVRWLRAVVVARPGSLSYDVLSFRNTAGDFNQLQPGRQFSGIWTIRNTGRRVWSGDFRVVYVDAPVADTSATPRDPMGSQPVYTLPQVSGRESVAPGETVEIKFDLVAPLPTGAYAFHWQLESVDGEPFGGIRWLRIGVTSSTPAGDSGGQKPAGTPAVEFGMNINPEAHGLDVDMLAGLTWIRWVYWASRLKLSPEEAYQRKYRSLIQTYAAAGIRSLIILHQDTEWGNAPWDNGGWEAYAETFARACGRVAAVCSEFGDKVAYQIFNEQDSGPDNHSAIGIAAENYAIVLDRAQAAIRRAHPGATVVIGGLNTGPDNAVRYVRDVQDALDGRLPVDALAIHPYGRYVKKILFNYGSIGKLSDSLNKLRRAFPDLPLWITEIGVASDSPIGPEHYADIEVYIREVVDEVADHFAEAVPVLIWFGWTDLMRNAGILTADGRPKPHVFDAFVHMRERSKIPLEGLESLIAGLESLDLSRAEYVSFATTLDNHNAVPAGTTFTNTWRFRNTGTTTWGEGYRLVYVPDGTNSDPFGAATEYELAAVATPTPIPPQSETEIVLTMTAPAQFGRVYHSRWQIRDPEGNAFGHLFAEITVTAAPTSGTGARAAGMTFVRDQTVPDGTIFVAGTDFHKQWLVRNTGARHWGSGFRLVFIQGDVQMARGATAHMVPDARPGDEVILSIPMTAPPTRDGRKTGFSSLWRLQDDHGSFFGDPVWAKIFTTGSVPIVDGQPPAGQGSALGRLLNDPTAWYSQLDGRWSGVNVGHGAQRIEAWGCLLTCMAMTLPAWGVRLNPQELNTRLLLEGENGFVGSNVQFIAPTKVLTGLNQGVNLRSFEDSNIPDTQWTGENPIARIDNALAAGFIVLAQVDVKPNNGLFDSNIEQHWVIIVQRTPLGDDYLILDPVVAADQVRDQPRSLMLKYGNRIAGQTNEENLRQAIKSTLVYWM